MRHDQIHVADEDRSLLERHQIGPSQRALLVAYRRGWLLGTLALLLSGMLTAMLPIAHWWAPALFSRELVMILTALGIVWLWRLYPMPRRWLLASNELREGRVAWLEGRVLPITRLSFGVVGLPHYAIRVGARHFGVSRDTFALFQPHAAYRVYYAPRSGCFLGAVSIDPPRPSADPSADGPPASVASHPPASEEWESAAPLSPRELAILELIAAGLPNKTIAEQLSLSINTVKMYCSGIYQKLGVRRRTEAVAVARRRGLLE